jgi:hypothetical protein
MVKAFKNSTEFDETDDIVQVTIDILEKQKQLESQKAI